MLAYHKKLKLFVLYAFPLVLILVVVFIAALAFLDFSASGEQGGPEDADPIHQSDEVLGDEDTGGHG